MSGGFESFSLMPELLQAVNEMGWFNPTAIQDEAIPLMLGGGDVMAAARTGSGKTATFCLPVIQCVHERLTKLAEPTSSSKTGIPQENPEVRLNKLDKDATLTVDDAGLHCDSTDSPSIWSGVRATHGVRSGKFYYECTVSGSGICRVGWSTMSAHLELGKDLHGYGFGSTGFISNASFPGVFRRYGDNEKFKDNDVIGCYIDTDAMDISFSKNGVHFGTAFTIVPSGVGRVYFPAVLLQTSEVIVNFGKTPFKFPPQLPGYKSLQAAGPSQLFHCSSSEAFHIPGARKPMALIIEPTGPLAQQVYDVLLKLTRNISGPSLTCALAIGGDIKGAGNPAQTVSTRQEPIKVESLLKNGQGVDILVGTIGKLTRLIETNVLDLSNIRFFILDEADALLRDDSLEAVMKIFKKCPGGGAGQHRLQVGLLNGFTVCINMV
jgi:ATP-dependent RNA helicase DDX1